MELAGQWLSLMEYATQNDVSLSTLRRHIKARKVRFRSENGRYLIWSDSFLSSSPVVAAPSVDALNLDELRLQLRLAREEIAELKTLVAFYEDSNEGPRADS